MSDEFWLGTALAIPLSIVGNLLSMPVQRWVENRSTRAADRARQRRAERLEKLRLTKADTFELFAFGFVRLLIIGVVGAVATIASSTLFAVSTYAAITGAMGFDFVVAAGNTAGYFVQILGLVVVINISMNTVREIQALRRVDI